MTCSKNLKSKKIARNKSGLKSIKRGGENNSANSRASRASRASSSKINSLNITQQVDTTLLRKRILESQRFYKKFVTRLDNQMTVDDLLNKIETVAEKVYKEFTPEEIRRFTKYKYEELLPLFTFIEK